MSRVLAPLLLLLVVAAGLSLFVGKLPINPLDWWRGGPLAIVVTELRLPRTLLAIVVGGGLGLAGAAMQGFLRNPLADPGVLGISACAALGAVSAIALGFAASRWAVPMAALVGAGAATALLAAGAGRHDSVLGFTLAGVALSSVAGALTALLLSLAPTPYDTGELVAWLLGALTDRGWDELALAAPLTALGALLLATTQRGLDALTLGEVAARSLGIAPAALRLRLVVGVGLIVGAGVAAAGVLGFVGLVVPHLVRPLVGERPSATLLPSALGGAVLLVLADTACRALPTVGEVRLGVATSVLGAPCFAWLLLRLRRALP